MIKLLPPRIALFYFLIALVLHFLLPVRRVVSFPYNLSGTVIFALGFLVMIWAWGLFKKEETAIRPTDTPTVLVANGPFRFSRNPMYLAAALMLLGAGLFFGSIPMLLPPLAFLLTMNMVFIPYEEGAMEEAFGEQYVNYRRSVRRWL